MCNLQGGSISDHGSKPPHAVEFSHFQACAPSIFNSLIAELGLPNGGGEVYAQTDCSVTLVGVSHGLFCPARWNTCRRVRRPCPQQRRFPGYGGWCFPWFLGWLPWLWRIRLRPGLLRSWLWIWWLLWGLRVL